MVKGDAMEWELDCNPMVKHIAQAQAKKLVEYIEKDFDCHFLMGQAHFSMDRWQELRRQVGLE